MQLTFDTSINVAYLRLKEQGEQVRTVTVSDDLNVDVSEDGTVYGIEFLNASEQLFGKENGHLEVINSVLGTTRILELQS